MNQDGQANNTGHFCFVRCLLFNQKESFFFLFFCFEFVELGSRCSAQLAASLAVPHTDANVGSRVESEEADRLISQDVECTVSTFPVYKNSAEGEKKKNAVEKTKVLLFKVKMRHVTMPRLHHPLPPPDL